MGVEMDELTDKNFDDLYMKYDLLDLISSSPCGSEDFDWALGLSTIIRVRELSCIRDVSKVSCLAIVKSQLINDTKKLNIILTRRDYIKNHEGLQGLMYGGNLQDVSINKGNIAYEAFCGNVSRMIKRKELGQWKLAHKIKRQYNLNSGKKVGLMITTLGAKNE